MIDKILQVVLQVVGVFFIGLGVIAVIAWTALLIISFRTDFPDIRDFFRGKP